MTTKHQISCITRTEVNSYQRILFIGGVGGTSRWTLSLERAILAIENGEMEFYVRVSGQVKAVVVRLDVQGRKFLEIGDGGDQSHSLLSLQECMKD